MKRFLTVAAGTAAGILIVIFAIMMFMARACSDAAKDLHKDPAADAPTYALGENFQLSGLGVSKMDVVTQRSLGSDGFMDKTAKGIFVVVTAHVTNNGTKAHGLDSMYQKLLIGDKQYTADSFAAIGSSSSFKTSVYPEPGFSDDITFVFDVPESSLTETSTTRRFSERTLLELSAGMDFEAPQPHEVKVILHS